ncbi:hypothetical protein [Clostridium sp.]|uniref:hypothetical protein n=1 Tax=Clostridium sp. TaxID=1506 RepID=UPI002610180E|nr:hypothetical protein [Clostridium sp.]
MNKKTANEIKLKIRSELCPDEIIGVIKSESDRLDKFEEHKGYEDKILTNYDDFINEYKEYNEYKKMVIILESPHVDEFDNNGLIKVRPSYGKTGINIREMLNDKLTQKNKSENYIVYLVNSIQYQCSLGINTNYFRDYVWLIQWKDKEIRDNLISRLKEIKPDLIINCCTKGSHNKLTVNGDYIEFQRGSQKITI